MIKLNPWCYPTATMGKCPLFDFCAGKKKPGNEEDFAEEASELCFERDDPTFYEAPEPEPWDEYIPEPEEPPEPSIESDPIDLVGGGDE